MGLSADHAFERASVISEKQLLTSALRRAYGDAGLERIARKAESLPLIRQNIGVVCASGYPLG